MRVVLLGDPLVAERELPRRRFLPGGERLAAGDTKEAILDAFRARYGEKVLSSPTFHGFNWLAWVMPFAAVLAGALALALTIRRWGARAATPAAVAPPPETDGGLRARLARELAEFDAE